MEKKESYRKKGMSSTSNAFMPPQKDKKAPSPPPGFDPLPSKSERYMKSGYSSHVHPNQSMFNHNQNFNTGGSLTGGLMSGGLASDTQSMAGHNIGVLNLINNAQLGRLPSGTQLPNSMMSSYQNPMLSGKLANNEKLSALNSYAQAMPKDYMMSNLKETDKINDFYKSYIDSLLSLQGHPLQKGNCFSLTST